MFSTCLQQWSDWESEDADSDDTETEDTAACSIARGVGRARGYHRRAGRRGHTNTATLMPFSQEAGQRNPLPHSANPLEFFNQMFEVDFFANLAAATNLNAAAKRTPLQPTVNVYATSDPYWHPTSAAEVQAFVGINIAMGMADLPEYKDYWSEEPILHNPYITSVMSRWRYEKLCQYFHCSLAAEEEATDKLAKVRPLITVCETNFANCFAPVRDLSVDEAMIRFDGRLAWKQYMLKKPVKWGVKVWCLCDSHTGYCLAFSVYSETSTDGAANLDLGYRVVMRLMRHHLLSYRHLYADNFTSVHLGVDLLHADTYLCGTTRATRREFPKMLTDVRLRQGELVTWTSDDGIMLCKWHDKRDFHMIATGNSRDDIVRPT